MTAAAFIHGMAWDHPRGRDPLEAISARWAAQHDSEVRWDARPLKDFEDQPLEELATAYDLVLIDHPFVGTAATSDLIVAVDEWVDDAYLADQAANSAGPSYASYRWGGRQWALAVDAACQVSAVRDDLLSPPWRESPPADWSEVMGMANEQQGAHGRVAIPLNPNHAYCAFLSVGVANGGPEFWPPGQPMESGAGVEALEFLRNLAPRLHPLSRTADPIVISDRMTDSDEIAYVPLMFGYSNYARPGFRTRSLRFADAPRGRSGWIGSVLGGVGLALSARSRFPDQAADLARTIVSPEIQRGLYFDAGGQPGHAAAWDSPDVNDRVGGFFLAVRRTMEQAFTRPRVPGHRLFQVEAGLLIHAFLWQGGMPAADCMAALRALADKFLVEEPDHA